MQENQDRFLLITGSNIFDFDEAKLLKLADKAQEAGIELFVLDDGWFGHRDADNSSLGDWFVDRRKLPHGLSELAKRFINVE